MRNLALSGQQKHTVLSFHNPLLPEELRQDRKTRLKFRPRKKIWEKGTVLAQFAVKALL